MKITALSPDKLKLVLENLKLSLRLVLSELGDDANGREGGYFRLFSSIGYRLFEQMCCLVGSVEPDKIKKYEELSAEKAIRAHKKGHVSSWVSRDPGNLKFGGAIHAGGDLFMSFSGLPEKGDEALMLVVAHRIGVISMRDVSTIVKISHNDVARRCFQRMGKFADERSSV